MYPTLFQTASFQLAVAVLLAIVPLISATPSPSQLSRRGLRRDLGYPDLPLPQGWALKSCYTDNPEQRTLTSIHYAYNTMSVGQCVNSCNILYLAYAGLENGIECHCGNITTAGSMEAPPGDCNIQCPGDSSQYCGGNNRLSLYGNGRPLQPAPTLVRNVGTWTFAGCYSDSNTARTLAVQGNITNPQEGLTVEKCLDACEHHDGGYSYAGVEAADKCWCDRIINPSGTALDSSLCSVLACSGNSLEYCGGSYSIGIYNRGR